MIRLVVKFWLIKMIFQVFWVFFFFKTKWRISSGIWKLCRWKFLFLLSLLFLYYYYYLVLAGNNELFRVTYSVSGGPALTTLLVFLDFFPFCVHLFVCVIYSMSVCLFTINLKFLKTLYNYWLAQLVYICELSFWG